VAVGSLVATAKEKLADHDRPQVGARPESDRGGTPPHRPGRQVREVCDGLADLLREVIYLAVPTVPPEERVAVVEPGARALKHGGGTMAGSKLDELARSWR
jgi:hypothetical protein